MHISRLESGVLKPACVPLCPEVLKLGNNVIQPKEPCGLNDEAFPQKALKLMFILKNFKNCVCVMFLIHPFDIKLLWDLGCAVLGSRPLNLNLFLTSLTKTVNRKVWKLNSGSAHSSILEYISYLLSWAQKPL